MSARDAKLERVNMLTLKGGRLQVRGLNSPDSPVVLNVSDNIKQANFYRCYTILPGGMAEGALASYLSRHTSNSNGDQCQASLFQRN